MEEILIADFQDVTDIHREAVSKAKPVPIKRVMPAKVSKEEVEKAQEQKVEEQKFFKRIPADELRKMTISERKKYYNWLRDRDREKVKGVFRFFERPQGELEFCFGEYEGDPIATYHFIDGNTYEIPLGVARHLNKNGWYPEYEYIPGGKNILVPDGKPSNMRIGKKVRRFAFQKLDFMEEDMSEYGEPASGLVSVEYVGNQNLMER